MKLSDGTLWVLVPRVATEEMWGGVSRDIVFWMDTSGGRPTGKTLRFHFENAVGKLPEWLGKEVPDIDHVPSKGTRAAVVYEACVRAAPQPPVEEMEQMIAELILKGVSNDDHEDKIARAIVRRLMGEN